MQSPTFTLVREHQGSMGELVHLDLYRLDPEEVDSVGLDELLMVDAVKVIEWADRLPRPVVADLVLELTRRSDSQERTIAELPSTHQEEA